MAARAPPAAPRSSRFAWSRSGRRWTQRSPPTSTSTPPGAQLAIALPDVPPLGTGIAGALAGRSASGDDVGLYGGSQDAAVCDIDELVSFLTDPDNADKSQAWAGVLDIDPDDIDAYVDGLTAVRLRHDTRVTNHGFADGNATTIQAVLQAGTAVLVDDLGVPRVKCACGNPLLPPAVTDGEEPANPDDAWDGFTADNVVVVEEAAEPVEDLTLLELDTGELFTRPAGSNGDTDAGVTDLAGKCTLIPDSPSCTAGDLEAFCTGFAALPFPAPDEHYLDYVRRIEPLIGALVAQAPAEIRPDMETTLEAIRAGLAANDIEQLFAAPEVEDRLQAYSQANCQ